MKFKIHRGTADRVAANLTLSEWPGIVKLLRNRNFHSGFSNKTEQNKHYEKDRYIWYLCLIVGDF